MTRGFAVVLTLLAIGFALFTAWWSTRQTDYFPSSLQAVVTDCQLPYWGLDRQPVMDDFSDGWYSGVLSDFEEPSLYQRAAATSRSVRFTWIRSFHDPIVVRVDFRTDGTRRLTAKQIPGGAGFNRGTGLARPRTLERQLRAGEADALDQALARSRLFDLPPQGCQTGVDGAQWIIEGSDPVHGYRFRDFQSPRSGPEREFGLFLLKLTGWDVGRIY